MRVGVDARHAGGGRGIAHYSSGFLAAVAERYPEDEWVGFVPGGRGAAARAAAARGARAAGEKSRVQVVRHRLPSRVLFGSAALTGKPRLDRLLGGGLDVLWIPAPAPVAISKGVPYVLTVHDVSWVEAPQDFTPYERLWHRLARPEALAANAHVVVAISHATKAAILAHWPRVDPQTVRVVHPAVSALARPAPRARWLPERYFLAVGALEPRKAPDVLANAFARARREGLQADLVFAGRGRLARQLRGRPGVHVVEGADRATIAMLYHHALALALPSHREGFGLTPLEAALAGIPAIVSDLPVIDETLGDAAVRVPPGDERAWAHALLTADRDPLTLAVPSAERAKTFSWAATADAMRQALADAAAAR